MNTDPWNPSGEAVFFAFLVLSIIIAGLSSSVVNWWYGRKQSKKPADIQTKKEKARKWREALMGIGIVVKYTLLVVFEIRAFAHGDFEFGIFGVIAIAVALVLDLADGHLWRYGRKRR